MTQRDRLIKILNEVNGFSTIVKEGLADYLLANGIIVLPCKAGDTVYAFCETLNQILDYTIEDICISDDGLIFRAYFHRGYELVDVILFEENDIGKTVFLTKEEAERAIKDGKNNE